MFKDLNEFLTLYYWLPYECFDDKVKKKVEKTKIQLTGNEMEKDTKHYVKYLNKYPNWFNTITIEIDKFLIDCEYIEFFMQMYMQWSKEDSSTSSFQTLIIPRLPSFGKLNLSQFRVYIETQTTTQCFVCCNY